MLARLLSPKRMYARITGRRRTTSLLKIVDMWKLGRLITLVLSISVSLFALIIFALVYARLPDKVPLFYSLVWGSQRLISKQILFCLPLLSLLFTILNISLANVIKSCSLENQPAKVYWLPLVLAVLTAFLLNLGGVFSASIATPPGNLFDLGMSGKEITGSYISVIALPFLTALIVSALATPVVMQLCRYLKIIDSPQRKHPAILHSKPVPRAGALPVFLGILVSSALFLSFGKDVVGTLLAAGIAILVGVIDDRWDINPYIRFVSQIFLVLVIIASGIGITFINNPLNGVIRLDQIDIPLNLFGEHHILLPADLITAFWIIFVANMISWSNGVDGQFPGIVSVASVVIGLLSLRYVGHEPAQIVPAKIAFATTGAILGTVPFVWHPARIFYGFGATSLGVILAVLSIMTGAKVATAVLILLVPILDSVAAVSRRILKGQSPFWGDSEHLHHHLLNRGWSQSQVALFYWLLTGICGAVALLTAGKSKALAILSGGTLVGLLLVLFNFAGFLKPGQK